MEDRRFRFLRYANCWEDSRIIREGLSIRPGEKGLSVASGGDNALFLLTADPAEIVAFDWNHSELACTELKMAGFRELSHAELLAFLGVRPSGKRQESYRKLREVLSESSRAYFDRHPEIIRRGLIHCGKFERYFQLFRRGIAPLFCSSRRLSEFCRLRKPEEQRAFYGRWIDGKRFRAIFRLYFGVRLMGRLGRDRSFYRHVGDTDHFPEEVKVRFEYGISHSRNFENPYLSYILRGNYSESSLPDYLREENHDCIRGRLDRLRLFRGSLLEVPEGRPFDFLNLSDLFEYMDEEGFSENERKLSALASPGARIALWNMQNRRYLRKGDFLAEEEESRRLFSKNRSYFYRDFTIYHVPGDLLPHES